MIKIKYLFLHAKCVCLSARDTDFIQLIISKLYYSCIFVVHLTLVDCL